MKDISKDFILYGNINESLSLNYAVRRINIVLCLLLLLLSVDSFLG